MELPFSEQDELSDKERVDMLNKFVKADKEYKQKVVKHKGAAVVKF